MRSSLTLWADPQGVPQARRMVARVCAEIGREDVADNAQLGVSELVTNALLHVGGYVEVRLAGTRLYPRVEVRDSSTQVPDHRRLEPRAGDPLLSIGHGLTIVARCAQFWGTDVAHDGKVVWFVPAAGTHPEGSEPTLTGVGHASINGTGDQPISRIRLIGVPARLYLEFRHHFRELGREIRLLTLAGQEYPIADELAETFRGTEQLFRTRLGGDQVDAADEEGAEQLDLDLDLPESDLDVLATFRGTLDRADTFGREAGLLTLPTSDLQGEFAQWFLSELQRQRIAEPPKPWPGGASW